MEFSNRGRHAGSGALFEYLETLVFSAAAVVLLCSFVFRMVLVDGKSMVPTLVDHDFLAASHLLYEPQKGDVVVVTQPNEVAMPLIKRIIATEGDTINIDYEKGAVYLNGALLDERYINDFTRYQPEDALSLPLIVPQGKVFVMGDNRNFSSDSRDGRIGLVDTRYIMGRAVVRLMPFDRIGAIS